jgi:endoglucanase
MRMIMGQGRTRTNRIPLGILGMAIAGACIAGTATRAMAVSAEIHVNQIGFHPQAPKKGVVVNAGGATRFFVATSDLSDTAFKGDLGPEKTWASSGEAAKLADFSALTEPGEYVLGVEGKGVSYPFRIDAHAQLETTRGAIRGFFYQRASCTINAANGGKWARNPGHPDNRVTVHASAASEARPEGTLISAQKGWYDAGDYNKYVVNSGISTYTLLALYRHYPAFFDTLKLNIPETGNAIPDLLDEALWNLRWMLAMQDPNDGGAYHKLTSAEFSGFVMPDADGAKRYVVKKSVTATLDLAATAAYASRLFRRFDGTMPGFADSALAVARKAWAWARQHPLEYYRQADLNKQFAPAINTGEYGDGSSADELFWAGAELYLATREDSFFVAAAAKLPASFGVPGWNSVTALGMYSLADARFEGYSRIDPDSIVKAVTTSAAAFRARADSTAYGVPMGPNEFNWGSNSQDANDGVLLLQAFRHTGDSTYLRAAVSALDYLLGRNATGYSYVTGFGSNPPMDPHHRPSYSDGIREPVPGLLVGGPNPSAPTQDKCTGYTSTLPAMAYLDTQCSYATNEIAINWNAPYAYLAGGLEAILGAGVSGTGIRTASPSARAIAFLHWEGGSLSLRLPEGWTGRVDLFDLRGAKADPKLADSAGGLRVFRLRARDRAGRVVVRSGTVSPFATARISLGR